MPFGRGSTYGVAPHEIRIAWSLSRGDVANGLRLAATFFRPASRRNNVPGRVLVDHQ